jgi:hypothetical protein
VRPCSGPLNSMLIGCSSNVAAQRRPTTSGCSRRRRDVGPMPRRPAPLRGAGFRSAPTSRWQRSTMPGRPRRRYRQRRTSPPDRVTDAGDSRRKAVKSLDS